MANILVTGGSGLIGKALIPKLQQAGHSVSILSRSPKEIEGIAVYVWNIATQEIDAAAFENLDYIIHLAGAGVADKRWTAVRKQEIIDSRVQSTELLLHTIQKHKVKLKRFIAASAIGYYGAVSTDHEFLETDKPADDFLGTVCRLWEDSVLQFAAAGIPITILRTGIVLSEKGGTLAKMTTPVVTPIGNGKQSMPWIHIDDMCKLYLEAVHGKLNGIFNAVAPEQPSNKNFSKSLASSFKKPFFGLGVPRLLLQLVFGEMSVILFTGSKISVQKLLDTGYKFEFAKLNEALAELSKK